MIPQLKPEIHLLIAKHVKRPYTVHDGRFPSVEKSINADQETGQPHDGFQSKHVLYSLSDD